MIKIVDNIPEELLEQSCNPNFAFATGGIVTKLKAANFLINHNKKMFLSSGFHLKAIKDFLIENIHSEGTLFIPRKEN
jgi:glutamate 5-kinase